MSPTDDPLREIKDSLFGGGVSPDRAFVQFAADTMRWPVDAFVTRTRSGDGRVDHHIVWVRGGVFGFVSIEGEEASAMVHPLETVVRVEIGTDVTDEGMNQTVSRKMTLHFAAGESISIDPLTFSQWQQRQQVDPFIDKVLDALAVDR